MLDRDSDQQLARRARVEVFVQTVRIVKSMTRNKNMDNINSLMVALETRGAIQSWEMDIEGIRGKKIFKKSIAILRSLMGDLILSEILPKADIEYLKSIKTHSEGSNNMGCLVVEGYKYDTSVANEKDMGEGRETKHPHIKMFDKRVIRIVNHSIGDVMILEDSAVQQLANNNLCPICGFSIEQVAINNKGKQDIEAYDCNHCCRVMVIEDAK